MSAQKVLYQGCCLLVKEPRRFLNHATISTLHDIRRTQSEHNAKITMQVTKCRPQLVVNEHVPDFFQSRNLSFQSWLTGAVVSANYRIEFCGGSQHAHDVDF